MKDQNNDHSNNYNAMHIVINFITLIRLPLTIIFVILVRKCILGFGNIFGFYAIIVSIIVFISDFIDGKIARKFGCVSKIGQSLDIYMDFIYILSGLIVLSFYHLIPILFIIVVIYKFVEFIFLSKFLPRRSVTVKDDRYFFDKIGSFVSVIYYIIPSLRLIVFMADIKLFNTIMTGILIMTSILTIVASFCKIKFNSKERGLLK